MGAWACFPATFVKCNRAGYFFAHEAPIYNVHNMVLPRVRISVVDIRKQKCVFFRDHHQTTYIYIYIYRFASSQKTAEYVDKDENWNARVRYDYTLETKRQLLICSRVKPVVSLAMMKCIIPNETTRNEHHFVQWTAVERQRFGVHDICRRRELPLK